MIGLKGVVFNHFGFACCQEDDLQLKHLFIGFIAHAVLLVGNVKIHGLTNLVFLTVAHIFVYLAT